MNKSCLRACRYLKSFCGINLNGTLGLKMGGRCIYSKYLQDRPDDILVCMTDSPSSCPCKYFVVLIITSANTLTAYDQEKMEKKIELFIFTKT